MPKVEKSGIYRSADGRALFLRKDRVVSDAVAGAFTLDAGAKLSESRAAIVAAESGGTIITTEPVEESPVSEHDGSAGSSNEPVVAVEIASDTYPHEVEPAEPVAVAPKPRNKRAESVFENVVETNIETPEDDAPAVEDRDDDEDEDDN